jgi:hypothetical protein
MPEKTRPYDPELDGTSPFLVKRYQTRIAELMELLSLQRDLTGIYEKRVADLEARLARQAPSTPEPEKSYARWVNGKGYEERFLLPDHVQPDGVIYGESPCDWVYALRDWLNDKYPVQDTLAEQEAGE